MTFDYITDPGHGWVKVPVRALVELGVAHRISECSYRKGDNAYLEEDCDAPTFFRKWKAENSAKELSLRERNRERGESRVRGYERLWLTHEECVASWERETALSSQPG
jgi:hypothetical protein